MAHISVMIPTYNRAHLITRTMDSVANQVHFNDFSVTILDDQSTDSSVDVINAYIADKSKFRLIVNEKNMGLTGNWNRCLDLATGPLIQIVQSDDFIDPDYLYRVNQIFEDYPMVGMVAANCRYIDANDQVIGQGPIIKSKLYKAGDDAVRALLTIGFPHVTSIVARKECYDTVGKIDATIWQGPDMEMDTRIAQKFDYYYIGEPSTSFRRHGTNQGVMNYLRDDFLETDYKKRYLTWGRLSEGGLRQDGIHDLEQHVKHMTAESALTGANAVIGYGRFALSRAYLRHALQYDSSIWQTRRFWKVLALNLLPPVSQYIMRRRMQISDEDLRRANRVEQSLRALRG